MLVVLAVGGLAGAALEAMLDPARTAECEAGGKLVGERSARERELEAELEARLVRQEEERAQWTAREAALTDRIAALDLELARLTEESLRREREFFAIEGSYRELATSEAPRELVEAMLGIEREPEPEPPPEPSPEELRRLERSKRIGRLVGDLLVLEGVDSLVLLEAGLLGDGYIGPVVCRLVDERGRPVGSLSADRLRLEASRAGRTLTIVLEDGYERRGGERVPFEGGTPGVERSGTRRIVLPQVDPGPWIEELPELFTAESRIPLEDDGCWRVFLVHRALNELLASDVAGGYWRVSALGGVTEGVLRAVELENLDANGHLIRRLLADRLAIELADRGVLLRLEDGVQITGGAKHAFLDGRYRIFLPSADQEVWKTVGLPGLVEWKTSSLGVSADLGAARDR